jgi:hypothetical protein
LDVAEKAIIRRAQIENGMEKCIFVRKAEVVVRKEVINGIKRELREIGDREGRTIGKFNG